MMVHLGMEGVGRAGELRRAVGLVDSSYRAIMLVDWLVGWMDETWMSGGMMDRYMDMLTTGSTTDIKGIGMKGGHPPKQKTACTRPEIMVCSRKEKGFAISRAMELMQ